MSITSGTRPLDSDKQVRLLISCLTVIIDRISGETPEKKMLLEIAKERHLVHEHEGEFTDCDFPMCKEVTAILKKSSTKEFSFLLSELPALSHMKLSCTTPLAGKVKVFLTETQLVREN